MTANFRSDNETPVAPAIMEAILEANSGTAWAYAEDEWSNRLDQAFSELFPGLAAPRIKLAWAGMIDTMPDVVPVIDRADALPGLTIATGMSGHGFGIGPGVGRVVADLVTGRDVGHDLSRFRLGRFTDGSRLLPGASL